MWLFNEKRQAIFTHAYVATTPFCLYKEKHNSDFLKLSNLL